MPVEKIEMTTRVFEGGRAFGSAGPFEELLGKVQVAIDPDDVANSGITDLGLVRRDSDGAVRFSSNWKAVRPIDQSLWNRRLFLDLPNRGGLRLWRNTNREGPPPLLSGEDAVADGWVLGQGYAVVSCGWQHDVPDKEGALRATLPLVEVGGAPLVGFVLSHLEPMQATAVMPLGHVGHRPYPPHDLEEAEATLRVRRSAKADWVTIPRSRWRFGKPDADGVFIAGGEFITLDDGFKPGCAYELGYTGEGAVPTGLGLLGVRDILSFFRYSLSEGENPFCGGVEHILAFGGSQPGAVLRCMEDLGLFRDALGRPVIDGAIVHGAGIGKSEANWRFGQPSVFAPRSVANAGPFSEALQRQPDTGETGSILHENPSSAAKMIYSITAPDYRELFGPLCHTELDGSLDLQMPENVRIYYMASAPHLRAAFDDKSLSVIASQPVDTIDISIFLRAAIINLDQWVSGGPACPPSRHPTVRAGTLISVDRAEARIAAATGQAAPPCATLGRLDFGPHTASRIVDNMPIVRSEYAMLACDVDDDGNDIDGLRHPEIVAPLATYLPWNIAKASDEVCPHGLVLIGSATPFGIDRPLSAADRRPPISERYATRTAYLDAIRAATRALVADRLVLADDEDLVVEMAARRYDEYTGAKSSR
ncbi:alpha/beta hydrolase domain-containing protein [Rhizorhabdus sp.]|uniref:alpha/beta hydrolase domain-containing protein n=1 Tax=Rhizorhabdus sp. TaxID=1968843 RepID=UPI001996F154|nr:alpha/beta hydrolase domain-containing protein [Rhizorhabdus sp.]MBD3759634.1 hypothetical protein [Rhizorhabdus sp.]